MIRGPEVEISYDPAKFPDAITKNKRAQYRSDPDFIMSHDFYHAFRPQLLDKYDLVFDSYTNKCTIQLDDFEHHPQKSTDTVIKVNYKNKFIKRRDLLPWFRTVSYSGDGYMIDGHHFPSITTAFLSMFIIDGDKIVPKPWKPYSVVISNIDVLQVDVASMASHVKDAILSIEMLTNLRDDVDTKTISIRRSLTNTKKLCNGIHNRLLTTERNFNQRLTSTEHDIRIANDDIIQRLASLETVKYEAMINSLSMRLEVTEKILQINEITNRKQINSMNVQFYLLFVFLMCLFPFLFL